MSLLSSIDSFGPPIMDVQHTSSVCAFSESSLTSLIRQQELSAIDFCFPTATNSRPFSTGHGNRTTIMEGRSYSQPPDLLRKLPQKRSNQSLTSGRAEGSDEFHSRAFSGTYSAKRLKGAIVPPLPKSPSPCNDVVKTSVSLPLPDSLEARKELPERADPAERTGDQIHSDRPKTLRSPFEYISELVPNHIDPAAKTNVQRFPSNRSVRGEDPMGYIYYAPTNPSDKTSQTSEAHRRIPRRQLSYGDPFSKPGPRSLHRATGSWELRHEAEKHAEEYDLDSWSESTSNASAARSYHSDPVRSKPRIWLDLSEGDKIQEAVSMGRNSCRNPYSRFEACNYNQNKPIEASGDLYTTTPCSGQRSRNKDRGQP